MPLFSPKMAFSFLLSFFLLGRSPGAAKVDHLRRENKATKRDCCFLPWPLQFSAISFSAENKMRMERFAENLNAKSTTMPKNGLSYPGCLHPVYKKTTILHQIPQEKGKEGERKQLVLYTSFCARRHTRRPSHIYALPTSVLSEGCLCCFLPRRE